MTHTGSKKTLPLTGSEELIVHRVGYASQPYVRFDCTGEDHYVWCGDTHQENLLEGVHRSDGGFYTFDDANVNCKKCLAK